FQRRRLLTPEDLNATLRDRLAADQHAAPAHRFLPRRVPETSTLSPTPASLLFRRGHHRSRGRPHANHGTARAALHQRQRRPGRQLPPQEIRCRHQPLRLVRSDALTLTLTSDEPTALRRDLLAIVDAALGACDPASLVTTALLGESLGPSVWM